VVSPDPMSPTASSFSSMEAPENTVKDPADSEPTGVGDIQMDYSFILTVQTKYRSSNKKLSVIP